MLRLHKLIPLLLLSSMLLIVFSVSAADAYTYLYSLPEGEDAHYALSGSTAIVAIEDEFVKVYTATNTGWVEQATLTPNRQLEDYVRYGIAVAIDGDTALVSLSGFCGGRFEDEPPTTPASVFVFKRTGTTWTQQQEIKQSCSAGDEVDVDGTTIAISDMGGYDSYSATIAFFEYNGTSWVAAGGGDIDFGNSAGSMGTGPVEIQGDTAVVIGEGNESINEIRVFKRANSEWSLQTTLSQTTPYAEVNIAYDGNTLITGNLVLVRSGSSWILQDTLDFPNGVGIDNYVYTFAAVEGAKAVVAVGGFNGPYPSESYNTYLYKRSGSNWTPVELLVNGQSIYDRPHISGNLALVGPYTFRINDVPVDPTLTPVVTEEPTSGPTLTPVVTEEPTSGSTTEPTSEPTSGPTATATSTTPPTASEELNSNPGFEDGSSLTSWTLKDASGDKLVCNLEKNVAHAGNCAFKFKNANDSGKLQQTINLSGGTGSLQLSLFALTKGNATGAANVVVKYADGSRQKFGVDIANAPTYTEFNQSAVLEQTGAAKAKLVIKGTNSRGKFYVDDVNLRFVASNNPISVLPLP